MPDLVIDDVPEELLEALHRRAARNGRTAEEEHLQILIEVLSAGFGWLDRDDA